MIYNIWPLHGETSDDGRIWPSACVTSPDHGECEKGCSNGWGHVALCPVFAATSQVRYFSWIRKNPPIWLLSKFFEDKSFHYICYAAPDIWSQWFWPSAAFGQRWIPWENIDSFVSSFSGGFEANWNKPKVDQQCFISWVVVENTAICSHFCLFSVLREIPWNSFQVKGSNRCFYILLVISFLVISCHFEGLYGFWGWNLAFVWTDQLDHVLTCSDILLKLIRFSFEVKSFRHAVDCTILAIIQFKGRKR